MAKSAGSRQGESKGVASPGLPSVAVTAPQRSALTSRIVSGRNNATPLWLRDAGASSAARP
jgi:hypothetical protein